MKPDYKNWMPKGMIYFFLFGRGPHSLRGGCDGEEMKNGLSLRKA